MKIKEIRQAKGMTLADLAKAVDTTPASISRYENGQRNLSILKAYKIAKVLGVTVDELIGQKAG